MGSAFETVCKQYMMRLNVKDRLPFLFDDIGRWWGGNPITKKETEIDLMAMSKDNMIIGECKWQNEKVGRQVYKGLREKAAIFPGRDVYYYIFSKSGFTSDLTEETKKDGRVTLVETNELFEAPNASK